MKPVRRSFAPFFILLICIAAMISLVALQPAALVVETNMSNPADSIRRVRHDDILFLPYNIQGYFDYKEALEYSRISNKPVLIWFTGHACANCREMASKIMGIPDILKGLKEDFVFAALYCDERRVLPEKEWYTSTYDSKVKKTIGQQNVDLEITKFASNAQPLFVILDSDGEVFATCRYTSDAAAFGDFLTKGYKAYYTTHKKM
jgi:thioredoxin-related protein